MVGAVLSRLTVTGALVALLPRLSVTLVDREETPSAVTVALAGLTEATPDPSASAPVQVRVTSERFQPAPSGAGLRLAVDVGAALSRT